MKEIIIIGAGLSGAEAAWQAANMGAKVTLYEMRPVKNTPAHKTAEFAELVCSNSLRGAGLENAVGVLKEEMRRLNSIIMEAADATKVPAGGALAVDRHGFSRYITEKVTNHPNITVIHEEIETIPLRDDAITIVASGPLTSSFILPMAIGACVSLRGADGVLDFAFGLVAMVAMTPLITIQILGLVSVLKAKRVMKAPVSAQPEDDYAIIEL